ncbi:RND family transporter [Pseudolysobacter antarcticus]|uniref:RND family transporter n=1 Tax=Pseudolysobacter antarcticus TaxID=2511995 RepID=A0A411HNL9_9GAMM|nr:MMPL family transporter [Pseudolysobacter antarcticus]QBB72056.1 RND family transporter [Pseudolysobacter antarcticus]
MNPSANTSHSAPGFVHRLAEKLVFGNRLVVLVLFLLITLAMTYFAAQLKVDAGFKKQIPLQHEYMQTFLDYERDFGGANRVLIAVMDKSGNMFNQPFFQTMENITKDAKTIDSVDDARLRSIFTPNVRFVEVVEDGFAGGNVIPANFTPNEPGFEATQAQFDIIRANIEKANIVGRLVAKDFSGAMVWVDLVPEDAEHGVKLDYNNISHQLDAIRAKYENEHTTVAIIGFAKMVGDITDGARSVIWFFLITIAFTWLLLFLYSSSVKLASLTVFCALIAVLWMLGMLRLLGFGIDPMNMLTPFLIFAIAVSHGEQMINRYRGEIFFGGLEEGSVEELRARHGVDARTAATRAFRALLVPGSVALIAGCIGFATILIIPIRIIFELAITATVGVAITILTDLILLPVLLSFCRLRNLERKREYRLRQLTKFDKIWTFMARFSRPVPAAIIILVGIAMWFFASQYGHKVMIGDAQKGVAELRPEARYNRDAVLISDKFALGVDILSVIAEAAPSACTSSYPVMETIDRFAWHMRNVEGVAQVMTLPMAAKIVAAGWNEGNIRWRALPRDGDTLRQVTQGFETDSGLLNADCSAMPIMMFLTDHRATTIDRVVGAVKKFREDNHIWSGGNVNLRLQLAEAAKAGGAPSDQLNLRLATGNVGVLAAINDKVRDVDSMMLYLLYAAVFVMCLLSFRNPLAALCIVLPLVLVTELGHALMVQLDIGKKTNTLTVIALGVGIGVDYAIYIFARMRESMKAGRTLTESYFGALKTTGIAIFYTALTLAVGVGTWVFSDLKFQADMGVMLTFMFVVNMIAAMVFLPALCRWLLRPFEKG